MLSLITMLLMLNTKYGSNDMIAHVYIILSLYSVVIGVIVIT